MSAISSVSSLATLDPVSGSSTANGTPSVYSIIKQLASALESGNLSAAQQAFGSLASSQAAPSTQTGSQASADFNALGQALQSGNLGAAQQAFANLQQAVVSQSDGVHGHHHHGGGDGGGGASLLESLTSTNNSTESTLTPSGTITTGSSLTNTASPQINNSSNLLNLLA